ncbi:MAG: hypothetical protein F6K14_30790 [Symploca sp. SIO2C1]|nr:hypothetical protein [Symploca sp. SIO2C1]
MMQGNFISLLDNQLIQTALEKTISVFFILVFIAVAIVAFSISVVLVAVVFPVFKLFKASKPRFMTIPSESTHGICFEE